MKKQLDLEAGEWARIPAEEFFVLKHQSLALAALKLLSAERRAYLSENATKARCLTRFLEALHVRQIDPGQAEMFPRADLLTPDLQHLLNA